MSRAWFWPKRCPSVLGGDAKYPDIRCQLRVNHLGQHFSKVQELRSGHATYEWDTAEDTAHVATK